MSDTLKIISWNVNGLNAALRKGLIDFLENQDWFAVCLQEVKVSEDTISKGFLDSPIIKKSNLSWNTADKNGYSGTITLSVSKPLSVSHGMGQGDEFDAEGRLITTEYPQFYLVNSYIPNAGQGLKRLDFKLEYNKRLWGYLDHLKQTKPVILTGDLNVAHKEIDLANPGSNHKSAGFTDEERESFSQFLSRGFVDTFRHFNPDKEGQYTYWSYRTRARERNVGWRLDYFVCNQDFLPSIKANEILSEVTGSDHCPICLTLDI